MTQRAVMTSGNPKLSYSSTATQGSPPAGVVPILVDDSADSPRADGSESWSPETGRERFPGWLRLTIIGAGALLGWAAVAAAVAALT